MWRTDRAVRRASSPILSPAPLPAVRVSIRSTLQPDVTSGASIRPRPESGQLAGGDGGLGHLARAVDLESAADEAHHPLVKRWPRAAVVVGYPRAENHRAVGDLAVRHDLERGGGAGAHEDVVVEHGAGAAGLVVAEADGKVRQATAGGVDGFHRDLGEGAAEVIAVVVLGVPVGVVVGGRHQEDPPLHSAWTRLLLRHVGHRLARVGGSVYWHQVAVSQGPTWIDPDLAPGSIAAPPGTV